MNMATSAAKKLSVLLLLIVPANAVAAPAVAYATHRECETFAVWRRDWRVFIFITSSCANENLRSRFTLRKEGEVAGLESPNGLGATPYSQADKIASRQFLVNFRRPF